MTNLRQKYQKLSSSMGDLDEIVGGPSEMKEKPFVLEDVNKETLKNSLDHLGRKYIQSTPKYVLGTLITLLSIYTNKKEMHE